MSANLQPICEGTTLGTCLPGFTCVQDPVELTFSCVSDLEVVDESDSNTLWIILGVIGGVLLLFVIIILFWMWKSENDTVEEITGTTFYR